MNLSAASIALVSLLVSSTVSAAAAPPARTGDEAVVRRFALIASANDGGSGRARLRFADSDAVAVSEVLQSLGGLRVEDLKLVPGARRASLQAAFDGIRDAVTAAGPGSQRRELFVYYSGHSDEEGLLLGGERVSYAELRGWIEAAGADVRIAVLDSCASGALIRRKGIIHRPPFLKDLSTNARGHAFLTASSENEAAQESDRVGAAFFTHYLVSGLRGAADSSHDGRVTLNEAYHFAYHETLQRTERTAAGAQHPAYDIQLVGTGDLVMTDLRSTGATLIIDDKVSGRLFVRDARGRLLVELRKEPLYPVQLGLGPGQYRVSLDADGRPFEANVRLAEGTSTRLAEAQFVPLIALRTETRGSAPAAEVTATSAPPSYRHVPFEGVLAPGLRSSGGGEQPVLNNFVIGIVGHSHALEGLQLSLGGNLVEHRMRGVQLTSGFNLTRGPSSGGQIAALANIALDGFRGVQLAGTVNVAVGDVRGYQASVINWSHGSVRGAQTAVVNWAGRDFHGAQIGTVGVTGGHLRGLQLAVLNVGHTVDGAQIGVVNIADRVKGFQLGVLNIGRSVEGASVGVISVVGDGYHGLQLWSSDLSPTNLGFKLGSRHFYTMFGFGVDREDGTNKALFIPQGGLGVHLLPFSDRFFLDVDGVAATFHRENEWTSDESFTGTLRVVAGFRLAKYISITAGPTYNVNVRDSGSTAPRPGLGWLEHTVHDGSSVQVRMFPGFLAGLQISNI
jgi:hypothetical protein